MSGKRGTWRTVRCIASRSLYRCDVHGSEWPSGWVRCKAARLEFEQREKAERAP